MDGAASLLAVCGPPSAPQGGCAALLDATNTTAAPPPWLLQEQQPRGSRAQNLTAGLHQRSPGVAANNGQPNLARPAAHHENGIAPALTAAVLCVLAPTITQPVDTHRVVYEFLDVPSHVGVWEGRVQVLYRGPSMRMNADGSATAGSASASARWAPELSTALESTGSADDDGTAGAGAGAGSQQRLGCCMAVCADRLRPLHCANNTMNNMAQATQHTPAKVTTRQTRS